VSEFGAPLLELPRRRLGAPRAQRRYTAGETAVLLLASIAFMGGLIHVGSTLEATDEPARYTVALALVAAAQMCSAAIVLWRPSRAVLVFLGAFNLGILALLLFARAGGALISQRWGPGALGGLHGLLWCAASLPGAHPGAGAGVANLVEIAGQVAIILGAWCVAASARVALAGKLAARISPALAAVLFVSVLYGFGSQAG
jgi:hypothetical protein